MTNDSLAGLVNSESAAASDGSFRELMIREYDPFAETEDWKRLGDKRLGKGFFEELYDRLKEEEIIPSLEEAASKGFNLLDISANNGSMPIYIADKLHKELLEQHLEPDNVNVYINDILGEPVNSARSLLDMGEYLLFGEKYSRNPLLCFSSESAYEPDFNGQKFDVIIDLKGALWYAASENKGGDDRKSVPETLDVYHSLLNIGGYIIIDNYEIYAESTVNRMLLNDEDSRVLELKDGNLELRPEYREKFEIKQIGGEHPKLRLVALKKVA